MSGVEVVGLVLGAIPLVISAIEHYRAGLDPLKDYSHYQSTLKALRTRLRIQLNLYEGTLKRLLLSELSSTEADALFPAVDVPVDSALWGTLEIELKLQEKLGKQYETFMDVVWEMDAVMKKLMDKLDIDMEGKPKWNMSPNDKTGDVYGQSRTRIGWEWRKIRRSFGKKEREELLETFERYNSNIASFVQNNEILAPRTEPRTKTFMSYFEMVRSHTLELYGMLEHSWKCPHPHNANLRLDRSRPASLTRNSSTFHVYFSYCEDQESQPDERKWKETVVTVDSSGELAALTETSGLSRNSKQQTLSTSKQVSISEPPKTKKASKFSKWLKYKDQEVEQPKKNEVQRAIILPKSVEIRNEHHIDCLCRAIKTAPLSPQCLGILSSASQEPVPNIKITTVTSQAQNNGRYVSLGSVIPSKSNVSADAWKIGKLSRQQRLALAVTLASSVLQFYNSPWLDDLWSKQDICFYLDGHNADNRPSISEPFITRSFPARPAVAANQAEQFISQLIVNKTLFALGIVLIELCLNKPFEDLRSSVPAMAGSPSSVTDDYQIAISNIEKVYDKGGSEYGYVVQRCLRCEFGVQDSKKRLDLDTFRSLVYEGVVAPLEEDLKKYAIYRGTAI